MSSAAGKVKLFLSIPTEFFIQSPASLAEDADASYAFILNMLCAHHSTTPFSRSHQIAPTAFVFFAWDFTSAAFLLNTKSSPSASSALSYLEPWEAAGYI